MRLVDLLFAGLTRMHRIDFGRQACRRVGIGPIYIGGHQVRVRVHAAVRVVWVEIRTTETSFERWQSGLVCHIAWLECACISEG